ncbi:hypothetical protein GGU45_002823 [Niabella hirudinis]
MRHSIIALNSRMIFNNIRYRNQYDTYYYHSDLRIYTKLNDPDILDIFRSNPFLLLRRLSRQLSTKYLGSKRRQVHFVLKKSFSYIKVSLFKDLKPFF